MKKNILTSVISVVSCGVIGFIWVCFLLTAGIKIAGKFFNECSTKTYIILLIASTFAAVSIIYSICERIGIQKFGFSEDEFMSWFCAIPFGFCFAADLLCQLPVLYCEIIFYLRLIFICEKLAYIMIFIFILLRLGLRLFVCIVWERKAVSDVYNSKS